MIEFENHIGKISVSDNYLVEIVKRAVVDCFGVADVCCVDTFHSAVSAVTFGKAGRERKGVVIRENKKGELVIDLHIKVTYGVNIPAAAASIVHKVSFAVEEAAAVKVDSVNVFVDEMTA